MVAEFTTTSFLLAIMLGTLLAIVYSLRILVILERRIARMEKHIEKMSARVLKEEASITKTLKKKRS